MIDFFFLFIGISIMVLLPFVFLLTTAFIKSAVLILILRNAIGIQQTPPNMVVYVIAGSIAFFVSYPVIMESYKICSELAETLDLQNITSWQSLFTAGSAPFRDFLSVNVDSRSLMTFQKVSLRLWPPEFHVEDPQRHFAILVPAFVMSELTRAFQMGFMIFMPFLAVDLIVTTILMALGMQQVAPNIVSVPFKLLMFVALDGWFKIVNGLILTYVK